MSEFQYYEFYSVDRELTRQERDEIDSLSSRFSPTSRSVIYTYSYSGFRHDEESVLIKYFDFFMYQSSWGRKRLMYKIPKDLVNLEEIQEYACSVDNEYADNGIIISTRSKFVIIEFNLTEEQGDYWIEEETHLSSDLIGLRQDLLEGDYRSLFLMWLHMKEMELEFEEIDNTVEIPVRMIPRNLEKLDPKLESLVEFYAINKDWILGVSKYSSQSKPKIKNYLELVKELPLDKKNEFMERILRGESNLKIKLKKEIDKLVGIDTKKGEETITLRELLESIEKQKAKRIYREEKELENRRIKNLKETEKNKKMILEEIDYHITKGTGRSYDEAMIRILKLKELSIYREEIKVFDMWIVKLRSKVSKKPAMLKRIEKEGL